MFLGFALLEGRLAIRLVFRHLGDRLQITVHPLLDYFDLVEEESLVDHLRNHILQLRWHLIVLELSLSLLDIDHDLDFVTQHFEVLADLQNVVFSWVVQI